MSIDPVVTDANTGDSFNRYAYANNNPYRYTDPDGRFSTQACKDMVGNCTNYGSLTSNTRETDSTNRTSAQYHFQMMGEVLEKGLEWYFTGMLGLIPELTAVRAAAPILLYRSVSKAELASVASTGIYCLAAVRWEINGLLRRHRMQLLGVRSSFRSTTSRYIPSLYGCLETSRIK